MKRYTERDSCGNAMINWPAEGIDYTAMINRLAQLEDWFEALIKDNSPMLYNKAIKFLMDIKLDYPCDSDEAVWGDFMPAWCEKHCGDGQSIPDEECWKYFLSHR